MRDDNIQIVLTGSEKETGYVSAFSHLDTSRIIDATGTRSLMDLMGIISQLNLLVSASTGAMHIAAGLRVPTVSLFCPLTACSPKLWGPSGNLSKIILPEEDFCQTRCPGDPHVCQFEGGIHPKTVAEAVIQQFQA
jgi:ADP-heptose:LPS heptosyltransferase